MRKKFKSANELFCWFLWWCLSLRRPKLAFVKQLCQWELEWNQHLFQEKLDKRKNESVVPIRDVTKSIFLWISWLDSMKSWFRFVTAPPREVKKSTWYRKKIYRVSSSNCCICKPERNNSFLASDHFWLLEWTLCEISTVKICSRMQKESDTLDSIGMFLHHVSAGGFG